MSETFFGRLVKRCEKERFLFVLVSLLSFLVLNPLLREFAALSNLLVIFMTLILISSVYAVSQKRFDFIIATLLVFPLLFTTWTNRFIESPALSIISICSGILFFAFMTVIILSFVLKQTKVTLNVIYSSVVVYLSIAMMWAFIFILLETLHPGSITLVQMEEDLFPFSFFYYSFVTITTLGYGDITPTSELARALALLEAVIGQIYLVVLVARLVGIHISQSMKEDSP